MSRGGIPTLSAGGDAEARRCRLVLEGALELHAAHDEEAVLRALPLVATNVIGAERAWTEPVTANGPNAMAGAAHADVSISVHGQDGALAALHVRLRRRDAVSVDEMAGLEALVRVAESSLERVASLRKLARQRYEADVIAALAERLALVADGRCAAAMTLDALLGALDVESGGVLHVDRGAFRPLALSDGVPAPVRATLEKGVPLDRGSTRYDWLRGEPVFEEDYALVGDDPLLRSLGLRANASIPVRDDGDEPLALIKLGSFQAPHRWSADERALVQRLASTFGAAMARITMSERQAELLEVVRLLAQAREPQRLYRRVVEAGIRIVPGADAGSLLVRGEDGTFAFEGAVGYDLEAIRRATMTEEGLLAWYGRGEPNWRAGVPRVLVGSEVVDASMASADETSKAVFVEDGRVRALRASLCVPIAHQERVLALLNVDSFSRDDAFGRRSVEIAQSLGDHAAVVVHRVQDIAALGRSALTDSLTGVGNRVAFNQALEQALLRARRYDENVGVAILDIDGFKRVNDTFGHLVGDRVLVAVAAALRSALRDSDGVFRWGGDEFALIMPHLGPKAASATIERVVTAVADVDAWGMPLSASVGLAVFPDDADDHEGLLRRADERMYRHKATGDA